MKALLINPENRSITEVQIKGKGLDDIYELMNCEMVEIPVSYDNGDQMLCDEESWLTYKVSNKPCGFEFPNWAYAILGKAIIVGANYITGDMADVKTPAETFLKTITWRDADFMFVQGKQMGII